jgi:aminoglycoside 2''-phosphotransferase
MTDLTRFLNAIHHCYPHLAIESARLNQEGQYNDVLIVNEEWVFRFAKFADGIAELRRETAILNAIQDHVPLAIPKPVYQNLETETVGEAFTGYRMLPGQPLWHSDFLVTQDPAARARNAQQFAAFWRALHSIPVKEVIPVDLPVADQPESWQDLYQRFRQLLYPHMRIDAQQEVTAHFERYFANPHLCHFEPVLRHGDFGGGNLLYDPATLTITGVIDFSMTTLGDPAIDFSGLFYLGEEFCRNCYSVYPELEGMLERVRFYCGTFALQEALYGAETGDREAFARGIEGYL